jgi:type VI protein secretion system component VasF
VREYSLRGAEVFWYILGCIPMGMAYFAKIPVKKAFYEVLDDLRAEVNPRLRGAEAFWYVLMCIAFGGGYFVKVSAKKGLCEIVTMLSASGGAAAAIEALHGRNGQRQARRIR